MSTPFAYRDLIEVIEAVGDRVDLVMVPKVASPHDVIFVDTLLTQIEAHCGLARRIVEFRRTILVYKRGHEPKQPSRS